MPALATAELADLRTDAEAALVDTCAVIRDTYTADAFSAMGSATPGTATYACFLRQIGRLPLEALMGGAQVASHELVTILFPHAADVRPDDRIQCGTALYHVTGPTVVTSNQFVRRVTAYQRNTGVT